MKFPLSHTIQQNEKYQDEPIKAVLLSDIDSTKQNEETTFNSGAITRRNHGFLWGQQLSDS